MIVWLGWLGIVILFCVTLFHFTEFHSPYLFSILKSWNYIRHDLNLFMGITKCLTTLFFKLFQEFLLRLSHLFLESFFHLKRHSFLYILRLLYSMCLLQSTFLVLVLEFYVVLDLAMDVVKLFKHWLLFLICLLLQLLQRFEYLCSLFFEVWIYL